MSFARTGAIEVSSIGRRRTAPRTRAALDRARAAILDQIAISGFDEVDDTTIGRTNLEALAALTELLGACIEEVRVEHERSVVAQATRMPYDRSALCTTDLSDLAGVLRDLAGRVERTLP